LSWRWSRSARSETVLDASIDNISLPLIAWTFHSPIDGAIEWVIIAYLAIVAATLMMFGRRSDLVGRKSVWMAGLVIFTLGSILCGVAGSVRALVAARVFQGLGAALIFVPAASVDWNVLAR
jgi:MFS family permease